MKDLSVGYYVIEQEGFLLPARWDGEMWNHERGRSHPHPEHKKVKYPMPFGCPLGCRCFTNPDGSVTVDCTPQ